MRLKFVEPLPTVVEQPSEGYEWIHEVKFDGYRSQIVIDKMPGSSPATVSTGRPSIANLVGAAKRLGLDKMVIATNLPAR